MFENKVLEYLNHNKVGDLYILGDFYWICADALGINEEECYKKASRKIRYHLSKMKKKGLIDSRRTGTGFLGKTDFGATSYNSYTLPNFWLR